jgi:ribosomal protein S18 acetylase RimI-like enzyme
MGDIRPFPTDPAVLAAIRPGQHRDARDLARLHSAAMGNSLWAQLGPRFLQTLYEQLLQTEGFLCFVYVEDNKVRGFIAGATDPDMVMQRVFRSAWPLLAVSALPALRKPRVFPRLWETRQYGARSGAQEVRPESLFCSFEPDLRGKRLAGHINKVLFEELLARGYEAIKISTELDNEAALRQLHSWGFEERCRFRFYGKEMVTLVLPLKGHPRLQAKSRHPMLESQRPKVRT